MYHFIQVAIHAMVFCGGIVLSGWHFVLYHFVQVTFCPVTFCLVTFCLRYVFFLRHLILVTSCPVPICPGDILSALRFFPTTFILGDVLFCDVLSCDQFCGIMSGNNYQKSLNDLMANFHSMHFENLKSVSTNFKPIIFPSLVYSRV